MSVEHDIAILIDRLKRADIPLDHLCYELDEQEWRELTEYLQGLARYQEADLSYLEDFTYMGLHIRKRAPASAQGEPK